MKGGHKISRYVRMPYYTISNLNQRMETNEHREKWEPIDSAPRDWTDVLLFDPAYPHDHRTVFEGYFDAETEAWLSAEGETVSPTHWQPLPEPPAQGGDE